MGLGDETERELLFCTYMEQWGFRRGIREEPARTYHLQRRVLLQPTLQYDDLNLCHFTDAIIVRQEQAGTKFYCCSDLDSIRGYGSGSGRANVQPAGPSQDRASAKSGKVHLADIVRGGKQALEFPWPVAGRAPQPASQLRSPLG